jgi:hypothetical protein
VHVGRRLDLQVLFSGLEVTTKPLIAEPPLEIGLTQETFTDFMPGRVVTDRGAEATVKGVTSFETAEGVEEPAELAAVTMNRYAEPLVSPVMVQEVAPDVEQLKEPSSVLATYLFTALEPEKPGANQETVAEALPALATTPLTRLGETAEAALAT